jgi:hypothetical protein
MPHEILLNAMRSLIRRCQQCVEQNGAQFEQFRRKNYIVIFIVRINELILFPWLQECLHK